LHYLFLLVTVVILILTLPQEEALPKDY